ncbi:MAG: hypothetical protein QXU79_00110 [Candidatus Micrarchaeaceae archaeon]
MLDSALGVSVVAAHERPLRWKRKAVVLRATGEVRVDYVDEGELWVALFPAWRFTPARSDHGVLTTEAVVLAAIRAEWKDGKPEYPHLGVGDVLEGNGTRYEVLEVTQLDSVGILTLTLRALEG